MTLTNLLGFISLLSLVVLLLIYILKPNYQNQFISSTYIWKLSLKFRKRKLPTSKLRNILLIITQVLLLVTLTAIIVRPFNITKEKVDNESIIIVDASASMRTSLNNESRFNRAIDLAKQKASETFDKDGTVSVVISNNKPYFLVERGTVNSRWDIDKQLDDLKSNDLSCSYSETELSESIAICRDILVDNPNANIYIYTDTQVSFVDESIQVVNVSKEGEYNFAILDAYAELVDNYYQFVVELAGYGRDESVDLSLSIYGANATELDEDGVVVSLSANVDLTGDAVKRVTFVNEEPETTPDENTIVEVISEPERVSTYDSAHIELLDDDCFMSDNVFEIYGGTKENIKVLYCSDASNSFFNGILYVLRDALADKYHIDFEEYKGEDENIPYKGYDLYIYEHAKLPSITPNDGIVLYADPQATVANTGFKVYGYQDLEGYGVPFTQEEEHPLLNQMVVDNIEASRYTELSELDRNYEVLATLNNRPVLLYKDLEESKIIVMLFSLHYSNLALLKEFPIFMINIFDYFLPPIVEDNSYEVNDELKIRSRSSEVRITGYETITIDEFPSTITLDLPGTYTVEQTTYFGKTLTDKIYAKIPRDESNIYNTIDSISNPISALEEVDYVNDWIFYLAIALCGLAFLEWLLKGNETV